MGKLKFLIIKLSNGRKFEVTGKSLKQVQRKFGLDYLVQPVDIPTKIKEGVQ